MSQGKSPAHLLTWHQLPHEIWEADLEAARSIRAGRVPATGTGHVGLVFFNSSLRTRCSMEVAAARLGLQTSTIVPGSGVWGFAWDSDGPMDGKSAEHIDEAIGVLSRYYDALGVRLFASGTDLEADRTETRFNQVLQNASVPVINLESAFYHPCQALADAAAIQDHFAGQAKGRRFVLSWAYHPRALPMAVPNSALLMASRLGMEVTVARPNGFELDPSVMDIARAYCDQHGTSLTETDSLDDACKAADVVYAKSWGSRLRYSDEADEARLRDSHRDWRIQLRHVRSGVFMHCLPVRRGIVVDADVLKSARAIHLLQAEYRLHAQMAILERLWMIR